MQNRLAEHLTTWKFWYAIPAAASLLLSSLLPVIASFVIDPDSPSAASTMALLIPLQFIAFALLALGFIALFEKKWPTTRDLGLTRGFSMRSIIVVAVGFAVSHLLFWLLAFGAPDQRLEAQSYFQETQRGGPLLPAFAALFASVILAPVCEDFLYRGATLRPIHDSMARRGSATVAAVVAILISSAAFALPPPRRRTPQPPGVGLHDHRHHIRPGLRADGFHDRRHGGPLAAELLLLRPDPLLRPR